MTPLTFECASSTQNLFCYLPCDYLQLIWVTTRWCRHPKHMHMLTHINILLLFHRQSHAHISKLRNWITPQLHASHSVLTFPMTIFNSEWTLNSPADGALAHKHSHRHIFRIEKCTKNAPEWMNQLIRLFSPSMVWILY